MHRAIIANLDDHFFNPVNFALSAYRSNASVNVKAILLIANNVYRVFACWLLSMAASQTQIANTVSKNWIGKRKITILVCCHIVEMEEIIFIICSIMRN